MGGVSEGEKWAGCNPALLRKLERMDAALVGPEIGVGDKAGTDWVVAEVVPLFEVTFIVAQLAVPVVALPKRGFFFAGPAFGSLLVPPFHPVFERQGVHEAGCREQVDVVGHEDVVANEPLGVFGAPDGDEQGVDVVAVEANPW